MIDEYLPVIESLEAQGFIALLKWDGERISNRRTVVTFKPGTNLVFRKDTNDIFSALKEGLLWAHKNA